ncbi:PARP-domain-containing protein [Punctularia strigosozonata HHB-11173 SS5]|uniref:PARP-domain-containing protein n=1 Tax=Punctularia strigosozonata (strain HHB-11173) TaxID=741275 RepID=UPI000441866C|nr:PARP-domain-containing protein [Punctularia strigosozonata HHB-11173 SS5]EIN11407.1 PARP-domain-containing protein [Punctularia strigosozonata HHB-11173 SS5]
MKTVIKRGAAPVDEISGLVSTHQVFADAEDVWDATLNQTNIGKNANKFYVIQLLHPIGNPASCTLYTRWGRVGENGQSQKKGPFPAQSAKSEFKKQFRNKSGVAWEQRKTANPVSGKYSWIARDYDNEEEESKEKPKSKKDKKEGEKEQKKLEVADSALDPGVQAFCKLIFSTSYIDATLSSLNYDANKLPLGKLAKSTILRGFEALKALSEVIDNPACARAQELGGFQNACRELSGRYYSIIPHAFGRRTPTTIDTKELLKRELDLVDALGDMEIASKLLADDANNKHLTPDGTKLLHPLDAQFAALDLARMDPVAADSGEFTALAAYARDTHGQTHSHYQVKIEHAFRVERHGEPDAFKSKGFHALPDGERMLLWHGSRSTNFAGILKQGLRIAPPEAPVSGYMFGKGVYFADMMSKSANYCHSYLSGGIGVLLLCEVAAKPFHELVDADYNADQGCKANGKRCTKGIGRTQPGDWQDAGETLGYDELRGCHMPKGPGKDIGGTAYLQYNEYIVYDPAQIRLRYLLMVKMN